MTWQTSVGCLHFYNGRCRGFIPNQTPTVHQMENTDVLDDLDNFVHDEAVSSDVEPTSQDITEDKCGPDISEGLANTVSNGFRVKISKKKIAQTARELLHT